MTVWEDYAIQLHDAINKNHMFKEPLIVMLSLSKIKDATGQCSVNWSLFYRFYSFWLINMYALDHVDGCFFRQVSFQCPKHKVWVQIVCQHRHYRVFDQKRNWMGGGGHPPWRLTSFHLHGIVIANTFLVVLFSEIKLGLKQH